MKKVMKFFGFAVIAVAALLFFAPKENLYYLLEKRAKPYGVIISGETLQERGLGLHIGDAKLFVKEVESAGVEKAEILCLGLYNRVFVRGIRLAPAFEQMVPTGIEQVRLTYSVIDPLYLTAEAVGEFGRAEARISLRDRLARVVITPSKLMTSRYAHTLGRLSKDEAGGYLYESRF